MKESIDVVHLLESQALRIDTLYNKERKSPVAQNNSTNYIDLPWLVDRSKFCIYSLTGERFYILRLLVCLLSLVLSQCALFLTYKSTVVLIAYLGLQIYSIVLPILFTFSFFIMTCIHLKMFHVFAQQAMLDHVITSNSHDDPSFSFHFSDVLRSSVHTVFLSFRPLFNIFASNFNYLKTNNFLQTVCQPLRSDTLITNSDQSSHYCGYGDVSLTEPYAPSDNISVFE